MYPLKRKSLNDGPNAPPKKRVNSGEYPLKKANAPQGSSTGTDEGEISYWSVQWRKPQTKKHKTWDSDGFLVVEGGGATLYDDQGLLLSRGKIGKHVFIEEQEFAIGDKDVQLECQTNRPSFLPGNNAGPDSSARAKVNLEPVSLMQTTLPPKSSKLHQAALHSLPFKPPKQMKFRPPLVESQAKAAAKAPIIVIDDDEDTVYDESKSKNTFWTCLWRKPQHKVNKGWDNDGILAQEGSKLTLYDSKHKQLGEDKWDGKALSSGVELVVNSREVQIGDNISEENYRQGYFDPLTAPIPSSRLDKAAAQKFANLQTKKGGSLQAARRAAAASSEPRYDPNAPDAIVMKEPSAAHQAKHNKSGRPPVPVVVDPHLAGRLRPHQVEGIKFMYESVMGLRKHEGNGCILADEMGLGKTLQTIALIWTLLKQNPYGNDKPIVGKVLVVCPVSLVKNWKSEFRKWLPDRLRVRTGDKSKEDIRLFANSKEDVLIIGYEKLRSVASDLTYCNPPIGLIICDEGHRLKSMNNKTTEMFDHIKARRRIILTGTPIQNDLGEFYAMTEFCNPGLLGDYKSFTKTFEAPIMKSRSPGCPEKARIQGQDRQQQLQEISDSYVIRRTADILGGYLPPKYEYVLFVKATPLQFDIFESILKREIVDDITSGVSQPLPLISTLGQVCNSPVLLRKDGIGGASTSDISDNIRSATSLIPAGASAEDWSLSGKFTFLAKFLASLRKDTEEKCVLVSKSTSTLDVIEAYCRKQKYSLLRLDGSTPTDKRQASVDEFNKSSQKQTFLFLLSTKAGGVGLNLIGASRLVLIDSDWNPAHDLQAMARIHRDGQKRPVFIYRLVTAGTIEEKVFQRQMTKIGLSGSLLKQGSSDVADKFSKDDFTQHQLKDLFTVDRKTACGTHQIIECSCENFQHAPRSDDAEYVDAMEVSDDEDDEKPRGFVQATYVDSEKEERKARKKHAELAVLQEFTHVNGLKAYSRDLIKDTLLQKLMPSPSTSSIKKMQLEDDIFSFNMDAEFEEKVPTSRAELLLSGKAIEAVERTARELERSSGQSDTTDCPGGTVMYVFERRGATTEIEK